MLVQQILQSKPDQQITTVPSKTKVADAAALLSSKRIGALVVSDDGVTVTGMFSERDIVRELGKRGVACLSDKVADLMTRDVSTCAKSDQADAVLQVMTNGRFRHLPVLEGGKLIGLISIGDVVNARLSEMTMEKEALEGMIKGF